MAGYSVKNAGKQGAQLLKNKTATQQLITKRIESIREELNNDKPLELVSTGEGLKQDTLTVPEVSKVLDCNTTYVYRAIKNDRIKALDTTPTKVNFKDVVDYVDSTLPPSWKTYYKPEQVA